MYNLSGSSFTIKWFALLTNATNDMFTIDSVYNLRGSSFVIKKSIFLNITIPESCPQTLINYLFIVVKP